jgi:hypothetical protein
MRQPGQQQRRDGTGDGDTDEPPVFQQIAQRDQQYQPHHITQLRQRHDQAGRPRRQADSGRDLADQRLRIVDVGHDDSAGRRQQHHHGGGWPGFFHMHRSYPSHDFSAMQQMGGAAPRRHIFPGAP